MIPSRSALSIRCLWIALLPLATFATACVPAQATPTPQEAAAPVAGSLR